LRLKKYCAEVDWFYVAGRRDRWRDLVNTVIELLIVELREFFKISVEPVASRGLCSINVSY
jgi:hypothetical protein